MSTDPGINNEESDGGEDVLALRMEVNALRDELRSALDAIEMARDIAPHAEDEDFGNFPMILPDSGASFSGTCYIAGNKTTGLGTKAWVRCFLDTATAEDHDGPPPNPFPPNEAWYEVSKTSGDIHIVRA